MNPSKGRETNLVKLGLSIVVVVGLVFAVYAGPAAADHEPADKVAVAGSALDILSAPLVDGSSSETHTLLEASMRTSSPVDLIFQVTLECALWTDITTVGNDDSEAVATVTVWVEFDGEPVAVADDDTDSPGEAVFCNRAFRRATSQFENENATIETFLRTRSANAFNWVHLDAGHGVHDIAVKARLDTQVTGVGEAKAGVGKRTLVVEPVRLSSHASV